MTNLLFVHVDHCHSMYNTSSFVLLGLAASHRGISFAELLLRNELPLRRSGQIRSTDSTENSFKDSLEDVHVLSWCWGAGLSEYAADAGGRCGGTIVRSTLDVRGAACHVIVRTIRTQRTTSVASVDNTSNIPPHSRSMLVVDRSA